MLTNNELELSPAFIFAFIGAGLAGGVASSLLFGFVISAVVFSNPVGWIGFAVFLTALCVGAACLMAIYFGDDETPPKTEPETPELIQIHQVHIEVASRFTPPPNPHVRSIFHPQPIRPNSEACHRMRSGG